MRSSAPPLPEGALHLWVADLDELLVRVEASRALLAPDELDRASRFHFQRDADRYVVCRGLLRTLLASYAGLSSPAAVRLRYGPHGKPQMAKVGPADATPSFNLAHSGDFALFAFTRSFELGVDVERVHDLPDLETVMRSCFAGGERAEIAALAPRSEQHQAFFRCWTRKEAVLKALGWGLAKPLDSFEVSIGEQQPKLLAMADTTRPSEGWTLVHVNPAPGYVGAAAWIGPPLELTHSTYEP
jgi:4'-phosphopantetheinyl transferase